MDESRGYFKLGLFVLITGALLAVSLIALGAQSFRHVETVDVETVINESIAGLETGSPVKYRGVTIGQVSGISFADAKYASARPGATVAPQSILVEMSLDPQKFKPLTADQLRKLLNSMVVNGLRVQLSQSLLSGVTVIDINYLDPKLYPAAALAWTPTGLYVPSAPSPMSQVVGGVEKIVAQLDASNLPGVIHHIDGLVVNLDKSVSDLQIASLREKVLALVDEVRGSNHHLSDILRDKRIDQILNGVATTASNAGPAALDIRQLLKELRELLGAQDENIQVIVKNIRSLTDHGRDAVEELKNNPSRLLLGSPPSRIDPRDHQ